MMLSFSPIDFMRAERKAARRRELRAVLLHAITVVCFVIAAIVAFAQCGCADMKGVAAQAKDPASWQNTERAAASSALDFARCTEDGFANLLSSQGPAGFSKDAALSIGETCGIVNIADGFAILVAVYRDVAAMVKRSHQASAAPALAPTEPTQGAP